MSFRLPREPTPIPVEPSTRTRSGLGGLVESTIIAAFQRLLNSASGLLSEIISLGVEALMEALERELVDINGPMLTSILALLPADSPVRGYLEAMQAPTSPAMLAALGGMSASVGTSAAGSLLTIALRPLGYELDSQMHTSRFDPSTMIMALWRGAVEPDVVLDQLGDLGWSPASIDVWEKLLRPLIGERDLLTLLFRGEVGETEVFDRLRARGYTNELIDQMVLVARPIASVADLQQLMHRGEIEPGEFLRLLGRYGYDGEEANKLLSLAWGLLPPNDLAEMYRRKIISPDDFVQRMRRQGYPTEIAEEMKLVAGPLTGPDDLMALTWRGELTPEEFVARMEQFGYTEDQVSEYQTLLDRIPGPGDLISMAVREAFNPEFVERYQYLTAFPPEFKDWMEKQGFSEEWAKKYWVAHWQLPSIQQAFRMFHRGEILIEDVRALLQAQDIAPVWHDPIINTAYNPLTRVDVRRMYDLGILGVEEVYKSYLNLGYSPENAEHMTSFTESYNQQSERTAIKGDLIKAYRTGVLTAGETASALSDLGFSELSIGYLIIHADYQRADAQLKRDLDLLEDQFIDGEVNEADVHALLGRYGLPATQVSSYLEEWLVTKERKVSRPTAAQLERFLKQGIIDEVVYQREMSARHYTPAYIAWYQAEIHTEIAAAAEVELERARREEDRVLRSATRTGYDVVKARYDLDIAELRVSIADNKVLLTTVEVVATIDELTTMNAQLAAAIKRLEEEKAVAKLAHSEELRGFIAG